MTPQETLKLQKDYCRVTEWNNAGYTGKGVKVYNCEDIVGNNHGALTADTIQKIAPDIDLIVGGMQKGFKGEDMLYFDIHDAQTGTVVPFHDFLETYKPKILSSSIKGCIDSQEYVDYCKNLQKKYNLIINNCAGNEGEGTPDTLSYTFPAEVAFIIGACTLDKKGKPQKASYSSIGEELDFMNFVGFQSGTSFATPWTAGEEALIIQRYGDMSAEEMYKYLKFCCEDMLTVGDDTKTGWGLIRLPQLNKKYITLTVDNTEYKVDGKKFIADVAPVNKEGNVFVPLRVIGEALGKTLKQSQYLMVLLK